MLDTKLILKQNLESLLATRPDISRLNLSKQMNVADGTLGRIKYGTGNPTVEVLEQIASFFKVETWQMLVPDLGRQFLEPETEEHGELGHAVDLLYTLPGKAQEVVMVQIKTFADLTSEKVNSVTAEESGNIGPRTDALRESSQPEIKHGSTSLDQAVREAESIFGVKRASSKTTTRTAVKGGKP